MAVKIGDKVFLNMPEQVAKNADDISKLNNATETLNAAIVAETERAEAAEAALSEQIENIKVETVINITYAELKALVEAENLVPGMIYRMTDYVTIVDTEADEEVDSAGHAFDLLIPALSNKVLSENVKAIQHEGDLYFAKSKLSSWIVKYCLDNNKNRFLWASESGKGVIYYLKDEFDNEAPFDFKNILYITDKIDGVSRSFYLFSFFYNESTNEIVDASIKGNDGTLLNDEDQISGVYDNIVKPCYSYEHYPESPESLTTILNKIIFVSTEDYESGLYYGCTNNTFGNDCRSNTFGNGCNRNTFGNGCTNNTFEGDCSNNTFGNGCTDNTFGNGCSSNTFESDCRSNTFGNGCRSNTFGNGCRSNTFGNGCTDNTFGNNCRSNTFGYDCSNNTFGNGCSSNTFGTGASAPKDYFRWSILENGVNNVIINANGEGSSSQYAQNIHIHLGVSNVTITPARASVFELSYKKTGSTETNV